MTAVAPDTIDLDDADEPPRLNLFLHQVTPNSGWRNAGLPSRSAISGERLTNAPLALDLHYLLTAYGRADFQAEILLGYGMHLLHERPVLDRAAIRRALNPSPLDVSMLPPAFQALAASDLADQVELIKITPAAMGTDEMSKLWTAIQSHYRPSAAYHVSVVLIEGTQAGASRRCRCCRAASSIPSPSATAASSSIPTCCRRCRRCSPPSRRRNRAAHDSARPSTITGVRLAGAGHRVRLAHRLLADADRARSVAPNATGTRAYRSPCRTMPRRRARSRPGNGR